MKVTLGGDRLGAGKKMKVELHGYERSTHNMGYIWRSTMSAGTLVPFLCEVALPGDTFDIELDFNGKTHPTVGPLFGSYKAQLDVFQCPVRLYQGKLHNNKLGIGLDMSKVKLPVLQLDATVIPATTTNYDNAQMNPSCLLAYLGIRGVGQLEDIADTEPERQFNGLPLLSYWDIYKNYYANKQEEIGAVIHSGAPPINETVTALNVVDDGGTTAIPLVPATPVNITMDDFWEITGTYVGAVPSADQILINTSIGQFTLNQLAGPVTISGGNISGLYRYATLGPCVLHSYQYMDASNIPAAPPQVVTFPLENLDEMREKILMNTITLSPDPFVINEEDLAPYNYVLGESNGIPNRMNTQEGLAIKTYQSDLFNNWLQTEWIDGPGGITEITSIDTSGGSFSIDTLNLSKKVYDMLNRIAVSGGTYDDWLDAVYTHDRFTRAESPIYHGGLIKELVFQEVVSNAESAGTTSSPQPLGTLAGKGVMSDKHKGGRVTIKVDEPSYIIGIVSLTPRVDYSQGNKWDVNLKTMDDFHKPALDEIGFQELITEQMAWWTTTKPLLGTWTQKSAGKQPAWINYMTNVNKVYGNFAIDGNEMFMTLNRRYEPDGFNILDLTTYIDPVKFNHIFAQTSIDAQNFWAQISVDMTARRKMSAKIMPNL